MSKKILLTLILFSSLAFFYFVISFYISEKNIAEISKNRTNLKEIINNNIKDLPFIQNDTDNVIKFNSGYENNDNNYKRNFWDLFKK
ncbi:MAG: hypothetical protein CBD76_02510 [Pelagibacteraceae bacterium TMED216]|nr:MAG: hypothetical protein CBD76_02510 [Pelagibacteraceae bacterium TMED216]|tara:strand:+ start:1370 stop:1630 length:261 start_codon:yes stop_codon:yes gene_type:complete